MTITETTAVPTRAEVETAIALLDTEAAEFDGWPIPLCASPYTLERIVRRARANARPHRQHDVDLAEDVLRRAGRLPAPISPAPDGPSDPRLRSFRR